MTDKPESSHHVLEFLRALTLTSPASRTACPHCGGVRCFGACGVVTPSPAEARRAPPALPGDEEQQTGEKGSTA